MAAAFTTRALVLGVVSLFAPVNGYQVTRELMSWQVEDWAKLKPGSVYSMLTTLTKQGLLTRHDLPDGQRAVAVYQLADAGRRELTEMVRTALDGSQGFDRPTLDTGLSFAPLLPRADVIAALDTRLDRIAANDQDVTTKIKHAGNSVPPHVVHRLTLDRALMRTERRWLTDLRDRLREGFLEFADEPTGWVPVPEDDGWEMVRQSERYREQIATLAH